MNTRKSNHQKICLLSDVEFSSIICPDVLYIINIMTSQSVWRQQWDVTIKNEQDLEWAAEAGKELTKRENIVGFANMFIVLTPLYALMT